MDLAIGDPRWLYHPVRLIGKVIDLLEKIFRKILPKTPRGELAGGAMLVIGTLAVTGMVSFGLLYLAYQLHTGIGIAVESFLCYQMLAVRSLRDESMLVYGIGVSRTFQAIIGKSCRRQSGCFQNCRSGYGQPG